MDTILVLVAGLLVGFVLGYLVATGVSNRSHFTRMQREFLEENARIRRKIAEGKARMMK